LGLRVKVKGSKAAGIWVPVGLEALVGRLVVVGALVVGVLVGLVAGPAVVVVDTTAVVVAGTEAVADITSHDATGCEKGGLPGPPFLHL
jgi:hypothetical protein